MARAYSLIEFAVSLAIAGVVATAAVGVFANMNTSTFEQRARAELDIKVQRVTNALAADAQEIGGGAIRPWHAMYVERTKGDAPKDAPSGGSEDRVLLLSQNRDVPPCTVKR